MGGAEAPAASEASRVHSTFWPVVAHVHPAPLARGDWKAGSTLSTTLIVPLDAVLPRLRAVSVNAPRPPPRMLPGTWAFVSARSTFSRLTWKLLSLSARRVAGSPSV